MHASKKVGSLSFKLAYNQPQNSKRGYENVIFSRRNIFKLCVIWKWILDIINFSVYEFDKYISRSLNQSGQVKNSLWVRTI